MVQLQVSESTGNFVNRHSVRTEVDMQNLAEIEKLDTEIINLANQIKKESQLNAKVTLNIEIQRKRKVIEQLKNNLKSNEYR